MAAFCFTSKGMVMARSGETPPNIVLLGPPGAGKSTIAEGLVEAYGVAVISTGQRLRAEVKNRSAVGREVAQYLERGHLVPDSLMDRLLRSAIESANPEQGLLLDGYPRTIRQALGFEAMLADYGRAMTAVVALEVQDEEVVRRLSGRRMCEGAGEPFPIHVDDLASMLRCRERGGSPVQRDDDRPDVVRERLQVYRSQTEPLLEFYRQHARFYTIDASESPAEVVRLVIAALAAGE